MHKEINMDEILDSCAKTLAESRNVVHRRYALLVIAFYARSLCYRDSEYDDHVALIVNVLKSDPVAEIRRHAAWAIGQLGGKKTVEPLILALADKDWRVRFEAVRALGITDEGGLSSEGISGLFQALGDNNMIVRMQALGELLCVLGIHDEVNKKLVSEGAEPYIIEAVRALGITDEGGLSSEGISGLFQALGDNNMIVRMQALSELLCVVGIHDEVNKKLVSEGAEPYFIEAVRALGITDEGGLSSEGISGLFQALGDNNMIVRMQALGELLCVVGIHDEVNKKLVSEGAEPFFL